jgi:hypothetical protein
MSLRIEAINDSEFHKPANILVKRMHSITAEPDAEESDDILMTSSDDETYFLPECLIHYLYELDLPCNVSSGEPKTVIFEI